MNHVFISYSKKNKDYARQLADHLITSGFNVWLDDRIDYGSHWETAIQKAIEDCAAFVVVMTPESRESQWVRTECEYAAQRGKPALPLLLAGTVFFRYVSVQYADVTNGSLPPDTFLNELEEYASRSREAGADVTPQEVSLKDNHEARPAVSRRGTPLVIGTGLLAALLLLALVVIVPRLNTSTRGDLVVGQPKQGTLTDDVPEVTHIFTGIAGESINIWLKSEDFDTYLTVLDENGSELVTDDDSGGAHDSLIQDFTLPADGNYSIVVGSFQLHEGGEAETGAYTLTVQQAEAAQSAAAAATSTSEDAIQIVENSAPIPAVSRNDEWQPVSQYFGEAEMVLVPPGCFDDEERGEICIEAPFWIDKFEVSTSAFALRAAYLSDRESEWQDDNHPRTNVTASESNGFCEWRGTRLPTSDEWEFAARGPDGWAYPWGNEFDDDGIVYQENFEGEPAFVNEGVEGATWVGALNMTGNVWEWTQPTEDGSLVRRGGGYDAPEEMQALYTGVSESPGEWNAYTGFRCAMDYTDDTQVVRSAPPLNCDYDWFFGNELAVEGECPLSEATGIDGIVQRFGEGLVIGIPLAETGARFLLLGNTGTYNDVAGVWDLGEESIGACVFETANGIYQILATHDQPDDPLGCPNQSVQEDYFDFQVADTSPEFVAYIGTSRDSVYRLSAASSLPDTAGEWQRIR